MSVDALAQLLRESIEYNLANLHTSFPGTVVEYNPDTRRARIQPYLKRKMPGGKFMDFPILNDVPIRYFGTKKYTVHLPLEPGDEVDVKVCERATDAWRDSGGAGVEDADPRRFSLMDCYATPGLQPKEFICIKEQGLVIKHRTNWDGEFIWHIIGDDDKIELKYKDKCKALMEDDKIELTTEHNIALMTEKLIKMFNGKSLFKMDDGVTTLETGKYSVIVDEEMNVRSGSLNESVRDGIKRRAGGDISTDAGGTNRSTGATVPHN